MPTEDFTERIDLLVNDEKRIVSYKVLSTEFGIHVNKAKQCLLDYANTQKQRDVNLTVHYFIAGFIMKDGFRNNHWVELRKLLCSSLPNPAVKICIVPEDKIEESKKCLNEITSLHVYSVYNGAEKKDECALYSADFTYIKDKRDLTKYSAIRHPSIEIQPPVLNKIQVNNDTKSNVAKKVLPQSSTSTASPEDSKKDCTPMVVQNDSSPEKNFSTKEPSQESLAEKTSPDDKKQKPGTLMSMWQKKEDKTNGVKKENAKTGVKAKAASKPVPKNSIMSMFSKQAVKNAEKPPSVEKTPVSKFESPKKMSPKVSEKEDFPKKDKPSENKRSSQKRKASNKNSKQSSKAKDSDSENEFEPKIKKKHRRICTFDDSSSESEAEEEREKAQRSFFLPEDPLDTTPATPMSEDEEPIPPTPPVINVKGRAKIWKAVQKTFEDDEGFFVTKTEKVLVSASEDEEEPVKAQPTKKEETVVNKKAASVNKKQASLMSFFKQK